MNSKLKIIIISLLSAVFIISAVMIFLDYSAKKKENNAFLELAEIVEYSQNDSLEKSQQNQSPNKTSESKPIFKNLKPLFDENADCVGWLTVPESVISYPVMQTVNEPEKYLNRDFYQKRSSSGVPFIDYRCDYIDRNIIIYGHNMKNGTMFGGLKKYLADDYKKAHLDIYFQTSEKLYRFKVTEVRVTTIDDEIYNELSTPKNRRLILSTCYGNSKIERLLIIAEEIL